MSERWGNVEGLTLKYGDHSIDYDCQKEITHTLSQHRTKPASDDLTGAEGGYLLIRFDVDGGPYSGVHVEGPAGWWVSQGQAPADLMTRAIEYLAVLSDKLAKIDALE